MTERDPTNGELLGAIALMSASLRGMIEETDRTALGDTCEVLAMIHENLALAGGTAMHLADRLGCLAEVEAHVNEGFRRARMAKVFAGQGGRA